MSNSRIYNRIQNNFTQISNLALLDTRLSGKAYKLYAYMVFRIGTSPDWYFYEAEILKHFKESRDSIRTAFQELISAGWLIRKRVKNEKGQFAMTEYEIFSEPQNSESKPRTDFPSADNPAVEKPAQVSPSAGKPPYINKEKNNKDYSSSNPPPREFFEEIWKKKNFRSDLGLFLENRKLAGWKNGKQDILDFERDAQRWEDGYLKKNPIVTKTENTESQTIKDLRLKIKRAMPTPWDYDMNFAAQEIEENESGFVVKVSNAKALQYQEILKNLVKIEVKYD